MANLPEEPALRVLRKVAAEQGLPAPTTWIGDGSEGIVFATTDPEQVCRVGTRDRVFELLDWQHTHAVVEVYYIEKMIALDENDDEVKVVVSWQERVDQHIEGFFKNLPKEEYDKLMGVLAALYHLTPRGLRILKKYEETQYLAEAIEEGMPINDLALESNLGVTSDGRVVAYDL